MSAWRREAIAALPEHRATIEQADSPMALWIELRLLFNEAMKAGDLDLPRRMLSYADWCISARSGRLPNDTSTAAVCAFYEHLPSKRDYWPLFREWFSPDQFRALLPYFGYFLNEQELAELEASYLGRPGAPGRSRGSQEDRRWRR